MMVYKSHEKYTVSWFCLAAGEHATEPAIVGMRCQRVHVLFDGAHLVREAVQRMRLVCAQRVQLPFQCAHLSAHDALALPFRADIVRLRQVRREDRVVGLRRRVGVEVAEDAALVVVGAVDCHFADLSCTSLSAPRRRRMLTRSKWLASAMKCSSVQILAVCVLGSAFASRSEQNRFGPTSPIIAYITAGLSSGVMR